MRFNVAQLLQEPVGSSRQYVVNEDIGPIGDEVVTTRPVIGNAKLVNAGQTVLAQADLETAVRLTCGRCLELFEFPLSIQFEDEYYPTIDIDTGLPLEAPSEVGTLVIEADHVLDLGEAVRQYALVSLPIAPLCREDCAGLCPQCGKNLNEGACSCEPPAPDSRWEALRALAAEEAAKEPASGAEPGSGPRRAKKTK